MLSDDIFFHSIFFRSNQHFPDCPPHISWERWENISVLFGEFFFSENQQRCHSQFPPNTFMSTGNIYHLDQIVCVFHNLEKLKDAFLTWSEYLISLFFLGHIYGGCSEGESITKNSYVCFLLDQATTMSPSDSIRSTGLLPIGDLDIPALFQPAPESVPTWGEFGSFYADWGAC